ncbi:hypothetical protein HY417_02350 [Candidatus Kaiserbacteria bacterium]|nr:hypothetical protein [Candidatus Kaiserbacteria bacterium]
MRAKIQKISKYAPSIFQGKLDFRAKRGALSLTSEHPAERAFMCMLIAAIVTLGVLYVYFVGGTTLNVIARKEARAEIASLATIVSELERGYFALAQGIGPEDGERLGLSPVANTSYVHHPGNAAHAGADSDEL